MKPEELERTIAESDDLPLLPQVVILVQKTIEQEESSARDLGQAIINDQVLTSKLLRLANSSYYRFSHKPINTVTDAIVLLGFETVKNITLSLSVFKLLSGFTREQAFHAFWRHSLCTALAAQSLSVVTHSKSLKEAAFVAGLLHDMGKVILAHYCPKEYKLVLKDLDDDPSQPFSELEKKHVGITHKEAGRILAEYWRLPNDVALPMWTHDNIMVDAEDKSPFHEIVFVANHIACNLYGSDEQKQQYSFSELSVEAENLLNLNSDDLFKIINRLSEQVYETARLLDIAIDDMRIGDDEKPALKDEQVLHLSRNLKRREAELKLLIQINDDLVRKTDISEVLDDAVKGLSTLLSPSRLIFAFIDSTTSSVRAKLGFGNTDKDLIQKLVIHSSNKDDICMRALIERVPVNTTQLAPEVSRKLANQTTFEILNSTKLCVFPILISGSPKGVMIFQPTKNEVVDETSQEFLTSFCNTMSLAFTKFGWRQ